MGYQKRGKPFTKATSKAGKATRFGQKAQPSVRQLPRAYRARRYGRFIEAEVLGLVSRGAESADVELACGLSAALQADPELAERFGELVLDGHAQFREALLAAVQKRGHEGAPAVLLLLARELERYRDSLVAEDAEPVSAEQVTQILADRKALRALVEKSA